LTALKQSSDLHIYFVYPSIEFDSPRLTTGQTNLLRSPLGLHYLFAVLRQAEIGYTFRDQHIHRLTSADLVREVKRDGVRVVGIHANAMTKNVVLPHIVELKTHTSAKVLIGGPGAYESDLYLQAGADAVMIGEGERRLIPTLEALHGNGRLHDIRGMHFRDDDGSLVRTPRAENIEPLDDLPFPYRPPELAPFYGEPVNPLQTGSCINLITSRGCAFNCAYCLTSKLWGRRVRIRSVDNVLAEIDRELDRQPDAYFSFVDDAFGVSPEWLDEFCVKVTTGPRRFPWGCIMHPLQFHRRWDKVIDQMKRAGCRFISIGAQSASPEILRQVNRSAAEPAALAEMLTQCRKHDIMTVATYILGLPGETHETMARNIAFVKKYKPDLIDFHPLYILPQSDIDLAYPDHRVTALTEAEIERACATAFRRFYLHPRVVWRIASHILRKNPRFLLRTWYILKMLLVQMLAKK